MFDGGAWVDRVQAAEACPRPTMRKRGWFLLGDLCLELESEAGGFLDAFEARWGDCIVTQPVAGVPTIRCSARALEGASLLALSFVGNALPDPLDAAGTPVRMLRHLARFCAARRSSTGLAHARRPRRCRPRAGCRQPS